MLAGRICPQALCLAWLASIRKKYKRMTQPVSENTLHDMKLYYRERAQEYDEWFYRQGRYDRGPASNTLWFAEADEVAARLEHLQLSGDVLELAPGTGIWTERLARVATTVTAVDASEEMIAINRAKVGSEHVSYVLADLFTWLPERAYDAVFFGFWLSHVPLERLDAFLTRVATALRPAGKLFFVDSLPVESSMAIDHHWPDPSQQTVKRTLNNGQTFEIVKNFFNPLDLAARFAQAGLDVTVETTANYFLYGSGTRRSA